MNVLSLFDGMSCGQIALNQLGLQPARYYAAEIKKHAIKVTLANYPDTVEVGDVRKISYKDGVLHTENGDYEAGRIDLLIGGSPCQDLSIQMADRKGLAGDKSSLFWEYVRIMREVQPRFFLLENVASMPAHDAAIITKTMGVAGVCINSALVSAQTRNRYYWTNIPGTGYDLFDTGLISQPADRNIMLKDILEHGRTDRKKAYCLTARGGGRWAHVYKDEKYKADKIQKQMLHRYAKGFDNVVFEDGYVRLLSRREMERLQTVPDGYTDSVTEVEAADLLGDGWTVEVIKHLFKQLKYIDL